MSCILLGVILRCCGTLFSTSSRSSETVDPELSIISTVSCPSPPWMVAAPEWSAAAATTPAVLVGPTASGGMRGPSWIPLCCFQNSCEQCTFTATGIAGRGLDKSRAVALNMPRPSASVTDTLCGSVLTSLRCEGCHLLCEGCQLLL